MSPGAAWRTPAARPERPRLSRDVVVGAGLDVLQAEGLDAVNMRRVAQELQTGPASLYAHVATKDELLELMLDRVLEQVPLPRPDPGRWQTQVKELLRGQVDAMIAHPGIAKVAWQVMVPVGPNALKHAETLLALLHAGGLDDRTAAYAADALMLYTRGFAYEGSQWAGSVDPAEAAARGEQMRAYMDGAPRGTFTHMLGAGEFFTAETARARFDFAIDAILGGLPTA